MSDEPKPRIGSSHVSEAFDAALIQLHKEAYRNNMILAVLAYTVQQPNGITELEIAISPGVPAQMEIPILEGTVKCLRYRLKKLLH